jgi:hypothetical protein
MEVISDGCAVYPEIMLHCIKRIREHDEKYAKFKTGRIHIAKNLGVGSRAPTTNYGSGIL